MKTVSVSVVTYHSGEVVEQALHSLLRETIGVQLKLYVIDNASCDGTVARLRETFPQAIIRELPENRGFGAGHNAVLPELTSDYHLILNPDVCFSYDVLTPMVDWLEAHPDAVLATPLILNPDGSRQPVPRRLPRVRDMLARPLARFGGVFRQWRQTYTMNGSAFTEPTDITFCTGCFMLWRTPVLRALGGFDEDFFLYCEDADLSRRAAAYGRLVCLPQVSVTHEWERGSSKSSALRKLHLQSIRRYFAKWRRRTPSALPETPTLSVALAAYNGEAYIAEQLTSILDQLGPNDEVIVSDDGSTDTTRSIVEEIAASDARVQLIDGPGRGVIANVEAALTACRGDILFLSDQDDVWLPHKVEQVLAKLRQTGAALILHDACVTDARRDVLFPSFFEQHQTRLGFWHNWLRNGYVGCCMAFRRELLELVLPFPDDIPMHDQWLGMLAEKRGGAALLPTPLIDYRRHNHTATHIDRHGSLGQMAAARGRLWRAIRKRLKTKG